MEDFNKKIVKGFAWEGSTKFIAQILSWSSTIIVARLLTPEDYGIVAVSGVFILLMSIFSDMGLTAGLINKKELSNKEITGVFWLGLLVSIFLYVLIALAAPFIEQIFEMQGLANLMMVSALMLIFASLRFIPSAKIMRDMNFRFRAITDMVGQFVMIVVTITLAYLNYGPWSLIIGTVSMHAVITLAYSPYMKGVGFYALHWNEIKQIASYGIKVMTSRLLDYLNRSVPTFFAGLILGQKQTGVYSLAYQVSKIPLDKIGVIFNRIIFPATSRIKDDIELSRNLFLKLHKVLLMISAPLLIGFSIVSEDLVILLFTEKWQETIPLLQALSVMNVFLVSAMIMPPVIEGMGRPDIVIRYHLITLVLLTVATLIGLQWGLVEMVYMWFLVYPITYAYLLFKITALINLPVKKFFNSIRSILIAITLMTVVLLIEKLMIIDFSLMLRLFTMILTGAIVYLGVYFFFFKEEMIEIKEQLRHFKS